MLADELPDGFGLPLWRLELRFPNLLHGDVWDVKQKCAVLFTQSRVILQFEDPQGALVRAIENIRLGFAGRAWRARASDDAQVAARQTQVLHFEPTASPTRAWRI